MSTISLDTVETIDKLHDVRALILSAAALVDVENGGKDDTAFRVLHQAADKVLDVAHLIDTTAVAGGAA